MDVKYRNIGKKIGYRNFSIYQKKIKNIEILEEKMVNIGISITYSTSHQKVESLFSRRLRKINATKSGIL